MPEEVEIFDACQLLGVDAVFGRPLNWLEVRVFTAIHKVRTFYVSRKYHHDKDGNINWPEWETNNPGKAKYLNEILKLAIDIRD